MVIWKGLGILNFVVIVVLLLIVDSTLSLLGFESVDFRLSRAFVFIVAGVIIWYMGKALDAKSGRVLIDAETGERYRMGTLHSLFFIPMHYWGPSV
ncbi:hypothetical protein [Paenibacillus sp. FSL R7-0273]|uniref:hypothetical protein n=1 Tax=Paenibacillus sp. FSL R7-0273 TaxID=1536772 RepID=UPI00117EFC9B|nr:hypothetical protein [Paenibacillus sp. FSL R7-0273]